MTKTVDFTKKIVCSDDTWKVIQVIPVKWCNPLFEYSLIVENENGWQQVVTVDNLGKPSFQNLDFYNKITFFNPEPQIIREFYKNIYSDGTIGGGYPTFESAKRCVWDTFGAITLQFLEFDDGTRKVRVVED